MTLDSRLPDSRLLLPSILATELRLLEPICIFESFPGYLVFRSDRFRNYYGGNGIEIVDPAGRSLAQWEEITRRHFEPELFEHTTYIFADRPEFARILAEAEIAGYDIERDAYMFVDTTAHCGTLPEDFEIRKVDWDEDWDLVAEYEEAGYVGADWYDPARKGPNRLLEKTRFTSEAVGIEWIYLARRGERKILSKLGLFIHNGIGRLQDVSTAEDERRKGYAGMLVSFAVRRAIETLGARGVALAADREYHAITLYEKLGFGTVGAGVTMMKYPTRNPSFSSL
jgi:ribosomal protein S18 acetylase RimI-like enzyme